MNPVQQNVPNVNFKPSSLEEKAACQFSGETMIRAMLFPDSPSLPLSFGQENLILSEIQR